MCRFAKPKPTLAGSTGSNPVSSAFGVVGCEGCSAGDSS